MNAEVIRALLRDAEGKGDQGVWDVINALHRLVDEPKGVVNVWYTVPVCVTVDLDAHRVTRVTMCDEDIKMDYTRDGGTVTDENGRKVRAAERAWGVAIDVAELTDPEAEKHGWPIWEQGF